MLDPDRATLVVPVMSKTASTRQLLIVALQDLHDAERAWGERGVKLRDGSGPQVQGFLASDGERSARQATTLARLLDALGGDTGGDPNIWFRAILDDAERDIASTVAGALPDTALIGAFRKGKQAERVSYETAIALAAKLGDSQAENALVAIRDEEAGADAELASLLSRTVDLLG